MGKESEYLKLIKAQLPAESAQYLGDDCAVVADKVYSLDTLVEGTHFDQTHWTAYQIGWKAAAMNISDIAAMGAKPEFMLVGLSFPPNLTKAETWLTEFYRGLNECSKAFGQPLIIGGDLTRSERITISIAIVGKADDRGVFLRSSAKAGFKLAVTGKFGNAAKCLSDLNEGRSPQLLDQQRFFTPQPRLEASQLIWTLNTAKEVALMDSSDGLAVSLLELAEQSGVRICFDSRKIPHDKHINLEQMLYGGEDFELIACLATVPEGFIEIGYIEKGEGVYDLASDLKLSVESAFQHF